MKFLPASLLVVLSLLFATQHRAMAQTPTPFVTSPIVVADRPSMTSGALADVQLDAPVSTYTVLGTRYWLSTGWKKSAPGGLRHALTSGDATHPYQQFGWVKDTCNRNVTGACVNGSGTAFTRFGATDVHDLWFVNLYQPQPNNGGLLAFIHEERVGGSGGTPENPVGRTRIGLAWSADNGNTWTYLGRILSAYTDRQPHNIQGAPYVIKDGFFHVHYTDVVGDQGELGIAVARAQVSEVVAAARNGHLGQDLWHKYYNGAFTEPGLGGRATKLAPWGITHTQAIFSSQTQKYYMPLTFMAWGGRNSTVTLYESPDALSWTPSVTVADETAATLVPEGGYQYCSLLDVGGLPNAQSSAGFHLYCVKDPLSAPGTNNFGLYRWDVELASRSDRYRQSKEFPAAAQGPAWRYWAGTGSAMNDMTWNASQAYWVGSDAWARIYSNSMHPGSTEMPVLAWIAPKAGTVRVEGTLRDVDLSCGDGVSASVVHNSTEIFTASINNADTVGKSVNAQVTVAAGDGVFFIVSKNANHFCDGTRWDPSIRYQ